MFLCFVLRLSIHSSLFSSLFTLYIYVSLASWFGLAVGLGTLTYSFGHTCISCIAHLSLLSFDTSFCFPCCEKSQVQDRTMRARLGEIAVMTG